MASLWTFPVGPQHPALHEPEFFKFKVDGEVIVEAEPNIGYAHRGIEKLAESRTYVQNIYLVERICGICNVAHTVCYCLAVEKALGLEVPPRAQYLRILAHELNRLHSHILLLAVAAEEVGFHTLFMYLWRDRELVLDLQEAVFGNRIVSCYVTIGGVRKDIRPDVLEKIKRAIPKLRERVRYYIEVFSEDPLIRRRFVDVGVISYRDAVLSGSTGPQARGSGVDADARRDFNYLPYDETPFRVVTMKEGDSWARLMVRAYECEVCLDVIEHVVNNLPSGEYRVPAPRRVGPAEALSIVEAPRGELLHHVIADGSDKPYRLKVKTPTFSNLLGIARCFPGHTIADVPAILVSMDPCFCCQDRLLFVDAKTGKRWSATPLEIALKYWR